LRCRLFDGSMVLGTEAGPQSFAALRFDDQANRDNNDNHQRDQSN
jgi:hypothetical protein